MNEPAPAVIKGPSSISTKTRGRWASSIGPSRAARVSSSACMAAMSFFASAERPVAAPIWPTASNKSGKPAMQAFLCTFTTWIPACADFGELRPLQPAGDDRVRAQGQQFFDVGRAETADPFDLVGGGRIMAFVGHADDMVAEVQCEEDFRDTGGQGDDPQFARRLRLRLMRTAQQGERGGGVATMTTRKMRSFVMMECGTCTMPTMRSVDLVDASFY